MCPAFTSLLLWEVKHHQIFIMYFLSWYLRILKVMVGEPLHRVERREMVVETDWDDFPPESVGAPGPPGVPDHIYYQKNFIFLY